MIDILNKDNSIEVVVNNVDSLVVKNSQLNKVEVKDNSKVVDVVPIIKEVDIINQPLTIDLEVNSVNFEVANNTQVIEVITSPIMIAGPPGPIGPQGPQGIQGPPGSITNLVINTTAPLEYIQENNQINLRYGEEFEVIDNELKIYTSPILSLTGGAVYERGFTVQTVVLNWSINKSNVERWFSGGPLSNLNLGIGGDGSYIHNSANITQNTIYTLSIRDSRLIVNDSVSIQFTFKRYWGISLNMSLDNEEILLFNQELAFNKQKTLEISGQGKYIYYCYPKSWGEAVFTVNGLVNTAWSKQEQVVTNTYNINELYYIYRTNTLQFGNLIKIGIS